MAIEREGRPYSQINFLVQISDGPDARTDWRAGFQEVTGLSMEVTVAEYRNGNSLDNGTVKVNGGVKNENLTLKRGVGGDIRTLYAWLNDVRNGVQTPAHRELTIMLLDETRTNPVQTWRLRGARPVKLSGPTFSAKGTDVAIEECVIAYERMDVE